MGSKDLQLLKIPHFNNQIASFHRIVQNIDGFQNPTLKIDGFHGTHRTHANGAPDLNAQEKQANKHEFFDTKVLNIY